MNHKVILDATGSGFRVSCFRDYEIMEHFSQTTGRVSKKGNDVGLAELTLNHKAARGHVIGV